MTERLRIRGGRVYDPAHGLGGEVRDVCIEDGRVVETVPQGAPVLDASGLVVMPGAVDIHSHVAGPKVNLARRLSPERRRDGFASRRLARRALRRSGTFGTVPSTFSTGHLYALLGYTTVFDAAVPLLGARHAHMELADTPLVDKGFYLVAGNDDLLLRPLAAGEDDEARHRLAWALSAARAYAVKVVNPGGVHAWKSSRAAISLDDDVPGLGLTPRRILLGIARAADALRLPHPMHLHCNDLGMAGNAATTLETMRALEGHRAHLAHLQFHCYGGERGGRPTARARDVIEALNRSPSLSADVGQVMFGEATTMTADARVGEMLHELTGRKWVDADLELEGGCGIVPYEYREKSLVHATQWAAGLDLLLLSEDPWRLVLSTDHPNGGTFLSYPRLVRWLMDKAFRDEQIARLPPKALEGTALADGLSREYTLSEIAIVTRAGPARLLGLASKGHLGPGADADVTIYAAEADVEAMFRAPRHVFKGGVRVVEDGQLRDEIHGRTLQVAPEHDPSVERGIRTLLEGEGTLSLEDYVIDEEELAFPVKGPNGVPIRDTFAEAFGMRAARVVITARSSAWAGTAAASMTGFATSVIGCKVEAGIEALLDPRETPDGRPGVSVLLFAFDLEGLGKRVVERVGQTVLTCPTTACFDGLVGAAERIVVGGALRHFGDRHQSSKVIEGRRYWRIPVMEGEFLVEESIGAQKAIGGGNFLILAQDADAALGAAEAAVAAMRRVRGVLLPFPGGIVRSGSKVGARGYKAMIASTNDAYCPTLRGRIGVTSELPDGVHSALEIVVNGLDRAAIEEALRAGIEAACRPGVVEISAGNYGGRLGKHHFPLHSLFATGAS